MLPLISVQRLAKKTLPSCIAGDGCGLWRQVANLCPTNRASALMLQMGGSARLVRTSGGKDVRMNNDGARQIPQISREYSAPRADADFYQEFVRSSHLETGGQRTGFLQFEFDVLWREADSRMVMGGGAPGEFVSALCAENALLPKDEEPPLTASFQGKMVFAAVATFWTIWRRRSSRRFGRRVFRFGLGGRERTCIMVSPLQGAK